MNNSILSGIRSSRAAIYCRVSSDGQEENYSLSTQEAACRRYCEERGWQIVLVETDVHTAFEYRERLGLGRLREHVRRGDLDVIVAYAVDRLSRKQAHTAILIEEASDHNTRYEFVTETFEDSAVGQFILSAKSFAAELEREKIIERTARGKRAQIESGKLPPSPRPPYGYQWNDDRTAYIENPLTAPIVRRIYRPIVDGMSLTQMARALIAEEIPTPTRGTIWRKTVIRQIIQHNYYGGKPTADRWVTEATYVNGKKRTRKRERPAEEQVPLSTDVVPPLVSHETWRRANEIMARNGATVGRPAKKPDEAILRNGFVYCGYCRQRMHVHREKGGSTYRCLGVDGIPGSCEMPKIYCHILDEAIWKIVAAIRVEPTILSKRLREQLGETPGANDLPYIEKSLASEESKRNRLVRHITAIDDEMAAAPLHAELKNVTSAIRQLEAQRDDVRTQQSHWQTARTMIEEIADWMTGKPGDYPTLNAVGMTDEIANEMDVILESTFGDGLSYEAKRAILNRLGVKVKVYKADDPDHERWEMETSLNLPQTPSALAESLDLVDLTPEQIDALEREEIEAQERYEKVFTTSSDCSPAGSRSVRGSFVQQTSAPPLEQRAPRLHSRARS